MTAVLLDTTPTPTAPEPYQGGDWLNAKQRGKRSGRDGRASRQPRLLPLGRLPEPPPHAAAVRELAARGWGHDGGGRCRRGLSRVGPPQTELVQQALLAGPPHSGVAGRLIGRLRADRPLISTADDLTGEAPVAERPDEQAATPVGGIRLRVARRTERHQLVEVKVRAPLGALDDVVDLEGRVLYWRPAWGASVTGSERM